MPAENPHRILLKGGTIADGEGGSLYRADVLIDNGQIGDISSNIDAAEHHADTIDVRGRVIAPGFVDVHSHDDLAVIRNPLHLPKLLQGVTTVVVGNCGHGPAPVANDYRSQALYSAPVLGEFPEIPPWRDFPTFLDTLEAQPRGVNTMALVPHGALRAAVCGFDARPATLAETSAMCGLLDEALQAGAAGMSLGLMYAPGCHATADELEALGKILNRHSRVLAVHLKDEGSNLMRSIENILDLGARSGAAIHISHLKLIGPANHGGMSEVVARLDAAREAGIDVTADVYPYEAGSTTVCSLFPPSALAGGVESFVDALRSESTRRLIDAALRQPWEDMENHLYSLGGDRILLGGFTHPEHAGYNGRSIAALAHERGQDAVTCLIDLTEAECAQLTLIQFQASEADIRTALAWPWTMIGSDGLPLEGMMHPRHFGTFPRIFARHVRELSDLSLSEAARKTGALPAERFNLAGRGKIVHEAKADLVVFDPDKIADTATYESPESYPQGIDHVIVAGQIAATHGKSLGCRGSLVRAQS